MKRILQTYSHNARITICVLTEFSRHFLYSNFLNPYLLIAWHRHSQNSSQLANNGTLLDCYLSVRNLKSLACRHTRST